MQTQEELAAGMRSALKGARAISEVKMFGGLGFLQNGNFFAAASKRGLLVRVGKERQDEALARPGTRPMVMRGRTIQGYVFVDPATLDSADLQTWLRWGRDIVRTLPAKPPKAKTKRKAKK